MNDSKAFPWQLGTLLLLNLDSYLKYEVNSYDSYNDRFALSLEWIDLRLLE